MEESPIKCQMEKNRVELGAAIKKLRVGQGLSVRKFALMVEMDYSHISAIENGRANATVDSLYKIANLLVSLLSERAYLPNSGCRSDGAAPRSSLV